MNNLGRTAAQLLEEKSVALVLGFEEGSKGPRPFFCRKVEDAGRLILDERCNHNLATYLTKKELIGTDRVALTAHLPALRTILQLSAENQLSEDRLIVLTTNEKGEAVRFDRFEEISQYLADRPLELDPSDQKLIADLRKMTREERWNFWMAEMNKCVKCYACRAACPLCYCTRCVVEVNCPQWVQSWSAPLTNMEWQINRVMHMAGRCVGCGACKRACPVGIPIHLLTQSMMEDLHNEFGVVPGTPNEAGNVLSTYKVEDKENFIK